MTAAEELYVELTKETIADVLSDFRDRVETIKAAGGVPLSDVIDGRAKVPHGWVLDAETDFYVPAMLMLSNAKREKERS